MTRDPIRAQRQQANHSHAPNYLPMPTELHLALQRLYAGEEGVIEAPLGGYRADVLRDGICYEIQTGSFGSIRRKLEKLVVSQPVVLVYPVPQHKTIVQLDGEGREVSARRSPKHGRAVDLFSHLLYLRDLPAHPNLSLEVLLTVERELRRKDGMGSWRRQGVSLIGRELVDVLEVQRFDQPSDLARLLPEELPGEFTTADLRETLTLRGGLCGKMAYALRELGVIEQVGKRGNSLLYRKARKKRKRRSDA